LLCFVLLSIADLLLTWWLLRNGDGPVYEGNPLANGCLARFGWAGLAALKVLTTGLFVALAAVISRNRPYCGGRLVWFGCALQFLVVVYSGLLVGFSVEPTEEEATLSAEARWGEEIRKVRDYQELMARLCTDLEAGRWRLAEAVACLADSELGRSEEWLEQLRRVYPGQSRDECLAANLLEHLLVSLPDRPAPAREAWRRLRAEYHKTYGSAPPRPAGRPEVTDQGEPVFRSERA
jgi:hypothetical protein